MAGPGEDPDRVGANGEEGGIAQIEQPGIAHDDVESESEDNIHRGVGDGVERLETKGAIQEGVQEETGGDGDAPEPHLLPHQKAHPKRWPAMLTQDCVPP
jgi:hypothetical protein